MLRINDRTGIEKRKEFLNLYVGAEIIFFLPREQEVFLPGLKRLSGFFKADLHFLLMVELVKLIADATTLRVIIIDTLTLNHKANVPVGFTVYRALQMHHN